MLNTEKYAIIMEKLESLDDRLRTIISQDVINAEKEEVKLTDAIKLMDNVRNIKDWINELSKFINIEYDMLRICIIPKRFESEGIGNSITVAGLGRCTLSGDINVSVLSADKLKLFDYLKSIGSEDIISESVPPSTLKAVIKDLVIKGEEIPEFIKVRPFTKAAITKK